MLNIKKVVIATSAAATVLIFGLSVGANGGSGRYHILGPDAGLAKAREVVGTPHHDFDGDFTADLTKGQVRALQRLEGFGVSIEPVELYYVSDRSFLEQESHGDINISARQYLPTDQTPWGIERIYNSTGSLSMTSGGEGVDVAVLDTGVNKYHLDLSRRVKQCKDFTPARGMRNGICKDGNGHGTHVSGTILADSGADGMGIFGVAPQANLWAYRVCGNSGTCWSDDIAAAVRHAADQGAEIVSMSLGGDVESSLIRDAINYATARGVLIVAAAGNDGPNDGTIDYPGANAKVVAVGAFDASTIVPSWSSRGLNDGDYIVEEREVEFGAPGVSVESTWYDGSYRVISGTSMATPHVSGLAAKLWQGSAGATRVYLQGKAQDIWIFGDDTASGFGFPHL